MRRYTDEEWRSMSTADRVNILREQKSLERKAYLGECVLVFIGMALMMLGGGL